MPLALLLPALVALGGCVAGIAADAASETATGKTVTDHALSAATGKDCDMLEAATREDRDLCEEKGSAAARRDYDGVGKKRPEG